MKQFDILERVLGEVSVGGAKDQEVIWAGRLTEKGNRKPVFFDGSDNFVVLEVGKRGSGKSFGMGAILEGFATKDPESKIARHEGDRRAVVLLDPIDVHWPALIPLAPTGPQALREQHSLLDGWDGLEVEPVSVQVFMPAGFELDTDHPGIAPYRIPVSEMTADDWSLLLCTDLITEPRGRAIDDAFRKVTDLGWRTSGEAPREPKQKYGVSDLIECLEGDQEIQDLYHSETLRSVIQALRCYQRMPLFSATSGTPMVEIARAGMFSILCLGRLSGDLRTVVATVFVRKLKSDRMEASQIRRRLALSTLDEGTKGQLEEELTHHVPRTVLAIDEAQILMPAAKGSMARKALDSYVLEGRNFGLSLWLATQRPKGAISNAAVSQIDTFIVHRLSVAEDVNAVCGMLQSQTPSKIRLKGRELDMKDLIRALDIGQAVFSSSSSTAPRLVIGEVRPRMVAHGGESF